MVKKYLRNDTLKIFSVSKYFLGHLAVTDGMGTTSIFEVLSTYFHEISVQNFEFLTNVSFENIHIHCCEKNSIRYY